MNKLALVSMALGAALAGWAMIGTAQAADPACEPDMVAEKYPGIAGKTIKIGADPQTPPYVFRDAENFDNVIGYDADLSRAVFACAGGRCRVRAGRLVRPSAGARCRADRRDVGTPSTTRPSGPSRWTTSSTCRPAPAA